MTDLFALGPAIRSVDEALASVLPARPYGWRVLYHFADTPRPIELFVPALPTGKIQEFLEWEDTRWVLRSDDTIVRSRWSTGNPARIILVSTEQFMRLRKLLRLSVLSSEAQRYLVRGLRNA